MQNVYTSSNWYSHMFNHCMLIRSKFGKKRTCCNRLTKCKRKCGMRVYRGRPNVEAAFWRYTYCYTQFAKQQQVIVAVVVYSLWPIVLDIVLWPEGRGQGLDVWGSWLCWFLEAGISRCSLSVRVPWRWFWRRRWPDVARSRPAWRQRTTRCRVIVWCGSRAPRAPSVVRVHRPPLHSSTAASSRASKPPVFDTRLMDDPRTHDAYTTSSVNYNTSKISRFCKFRSSKQALNESCSQNKDIGYRGKAEE